MSSSGHSTCTYVDVCTPTLSINLGMNVFVYAITYVLVFLYTYVSVSTHIHADTVCKVVAHYMLSNFGFFILLTRGMFITPHADNFNILGGGRRIAHTYAS